MKIIVFIALTAWVTLSCNRAPLLNGTYSGTFIVNYGSGIQEGPFQLEIKDNSYRCSGNENRLPAGGSGTFSFGQNEIVFQDENMWTADFDWNLILNGSYSLVQMDDTLSLTKKQGQAKYVYKIGLKP
jgi:hypothetical protein